MLHILLHIYPNFIVLKHNNNNNQQNLLPKLGFDVGGQGHEVEDEVDDDQGGGEGEVDGGVGPGLQQLVQAGAGVAVFVHQVVRAVDVPAGQDNYVS